jgi:hypothetical protein
MQFWRGTGDALFVPTIANPATPTASELTAGTSIALGLTAISGFEDAANQINVQLLAYSQDVQVNGPSQWGTSSVTLIEDDGVGSNTDDVARRAILTALGTKGITGYMVFSRFVKKAALVSTKKVDVWAVQISTINPQYTLDAAVATRVVNLSIQSAPNINVAVT